MMSNQFIPFLTVLISIGTLVAAMILLVRAKDDPNLQRTIVSIAAVIICLSYIIACVITYLVGMILVVIGTALFACFFILLALSVGICIIVLPIAAIFHWLFKR